jgi:hypothetical protein
MIKDVFNVIDLSILGSAAEIWDEWRFEPWTDGAASGLYRRLSIVKDGLLGEVARYYADDYIIWKYAPEDFERLLKETRPKRDVMTQRFVFLQREGGSFSKRRSIWLGFRGFVEAHMYTLGSEAKTETQDLAYLANQAAKKTGI